VTRTVVLSGSLGSTSAMWEAQEAALDGFDAIRIEHPGHGGAPVEEIRDMGGLARRVLASVHADRFSFVGLSLGGAIGMRLALDAPERLDKLVLACTAARFGEPAAWQERAELVRAEGLEAIVDAVLARWFTPSFPDVQRFRAMFVSTDREGYARCCEAIRDWDARDELSRIETPTLVIAGEDDPAAPLADLELVADRIAGARLAVLPRARHLANVEFAEAFNAELRPFL
jgi:3-oxoadipate enol-lactonase